LGVFVPFSSFLIALSASAARLENADGFCTSAKGDFGMAYFLAKVDAIDVLRRAAIFVGEILLHCVDDFALPCKNA
jgi:hypothetical protein